MIKVLGFTILGDFDSEFFIVNRCVLYITPPPPPWTFGSKNWQTKANKCRSQEPEKLLSCLLFLFLWQNRSKELKGEKCYSGSRFEGVVHHSGHKVRLLADIGMEQVADQGEFQYSAFSLFSCLQSGCPARFKLGLPSQLNLSEKTLMDVPSGFSLEMINLVSLAGKANFPSYHDVDSLVSSQYGLHSN